MLKVLVQKEIRDQLKSSRFVILALLGFVFVAVVRL